MGDLPRIFSSNEQLRRGHSFTVPDRVSQSSEAMADAGYGFRLTAYALLSTTSDDEARNLATPQNQERGSERTFPIASIGSWQDRGNREISGMQAAPCVVSPGLQAAPCVLLVLAFAVLSVVKNLQVINDPAHPEFSTNGCRGSLGQASHLKPWLVCLDPGHHPPTPWCPWHGILYPALGKVKECLYGNDEPPGVPLDFLFTLGGVVWPRRGAAH